MSFQNIIGKWDNHDDSCRGCRQGKPGQTLDKRCEQGCRKMAENEIGKFKRSKKMKSKLTLN